MVSQLLGRFKKMNVFILIYEYIIKYEYKIVKIHTLRSAMRNSRTDRLQFCFSFIVYIHININIYIYICSYYNKIKTKLIYVILLKIMLYIIFFISPFRHFSLKLILKK